VADSTLPMVFLPLHGIMVHESMSYKVGF